MTSNEDCKPANCTRMCPSCFGLFERASGLILMAHSKEMSRFAIIQKEIYHVVKSFRESLQEKTKAVPEVCSFFWAIGQLDGFQDLVLENPFAMKKKTTNVAVDANLSSKPRPVNMNRINLSPIPENRLKSEEKENSFRSPRVPVTSPVKQQPAGKQQTNQLFSQESSLEEASNRRRSTSNTSNTRKQSAQTSDNKQKHTHNISDLDARIQELEREKKIVEKEAAINDSPALFHQPRKVNPAASKEGKSIETNMSVTEEEKKTNRTLELKPHGELDRDSSVKPSHQNSRQEQPSKSVKKKDRIALVYKVNTKQIDFDKYERKKSRVPARRDEPEVSLAQKNKSVLLPHDASDSLSLNEDDQLSKNLKSLESSTVRDKSAPPKKVLIKPLEDLDKIKKSIDCSKNHIDTPHF